MRRENRATRVCDLHPVSELAWRQPVIVVLAEPETLKAREDLFRSANLHVVPCCGHDTSAMVKIAVDVFFGEGLACACHQASELLAGRNWQCPAVVGKSIAAL